MSTNRLTRRRKKKRANTLDPSSQSFADSKRFALSASPNGKKLKAKKSSQTPRMTKSKSPTRFPTQKQLNKNIKNKKFNKKNKKNNRRKRADSDADFIGIGYNKFNIKPLNENDTNTVKHINSISLSINMNDTTSNTTKSAKKTSKKRNKKVTSQTPQTDYVGVISIGNDPFGTKKSNKKKNKNKIKHVSSMTPVINSSMTSIADGDSDLDDDYTTPSMKDKSRAQSARFSNNQKKKNSAIISNNIFGIKTKNKNKNKNLIKIDGSNSVNQAFKLLDNSSTNIRKNIINSFKIYHKTLNKKQDKLLDELDTIYDDKKGIVNEAETKLMKNRSKPIKFDPNIKLNLNDDKCIQQIMGFGDVYGNANGNANGSNRLNGNGSGSGVGNSNNKDDDYKYGLDDDNVGDNGQSIAEKQKKILNAIQNRTMDKLNKIIFMEKDAKQKKILADDLTKEVDESLKNIDLRTVEINEKIIDAKPELDKARAAVSGIDPKEINEIKSLKSPPKVIETVITATAMILGHKITEWRDVQRILSNKFKPNLLNFDTYTLTKKQRYKVYKKYVHGNADFNYDRVVVGNKVCGNLVLWVLSQIKYSRLLDIIIPLQKELKKIKKESKKKQKLAKTLLKVVRELNVNINLYQLQCNEMVDDIIKSTDNKLKEFESKLKPLNLKFNSILQNKILD